MADTPALDPARLPRHIAMIMDGNGRWARERGLERIEGHVRGAETVRRMVEECCRLGIGHLTLYSFSSENWKRPQREVDFLMSLLKEYLVGERPEIMRVSNYLLWQISYAELWVTPVYWPEFTTEVFHSALRDYAGRERRFGGLQPVPA